MVTQEILKFYYYYHYYFLYYSKRVTLLALKPGYQVALFNNIYNIDSNIYNIIQIKAIVIFRIH